MEGEIGFVCAVPFSSVVRHLHRLRVTPGPKYAAFADLFEFSVAVATLPQIVQHAGQVRDISRRLTA